MKITAGNAINLKTNLDNFAQRQVPFALVITKNIKKLEKIVADFEEKKDAALHKYAILDEAGNFIPATKEDGTKYENPQTIDQIELSDRDALVKTISELENTEYDVDFETIDTEKLYYDSKIGEKMKVADFIDANMEPALIMYLAQFEIIAL